MARNRLTEDEVLAVHEAAHAVFAVAGEWTKLAGPIILKGRGDGDVVMSTDTEAIRRSIEADPGFDRDLPRIHLIRSLLAGPMAERILMETGRAALTEQDLREAGRCDYAVVAEQLDQLSPPRPGLLDRLEREVREKLEEPATWSAVERFAATLIERRRLGAQEASAMLGTVRAGRSPPGPKRRGRRLALLLAFLLWEAWWVWEFVAAPRPDREMRIAAAVALGMILPGLAIALGALAMLLRGAAHRGRGQRGSRIG
jgi:hypothetical protein